VTRERVEAFARKYLGEDNRASLVFVPREPMSQPEEVAELATATS
jgi:hypothetical protein